MSGLSLIPVFMIGLLGSVHCVGMCGGIVGAFSTVQPTRRFPVAVVTHRGGAAMRQVGVTGPGAMDGVAMHAGVLKEFLRSALFNFGRIGSYAIAGAIAGGMVGGARTLSGVAGLQLGGYWLANLMLVALGLYLMDAWRGLARIEACGQYVWRRIQPLMRHALPADRPLKMLALGSLWGWLPCGMVYSVLLTASLSGSASGGAAVMLAFGMGTLPMLMAMGLVGARLQQWMQRRPVRVICGSVVLGFGLLGLFRAAQGSPASWLDALCIGAT